MKKIIVAAFTIAFAAVSQAAVINWSISNVKQADAAGSSVNVATGSYSALLFVTTNTTGVDVTTASKSTILAALTEAHTNGGWDSISSTIASAAAVNKANNGAGLWSGATGLPTTFASGSLSAFAVIFDAANIAEATNYYIVNGGDEMSVAFTSATGTKTLGFATQATNSALPIDSPNGWTSIAPEPTSGLLMLLGMGALALRRRRA